MALVFGALAALFGAYQAWLLPVLTDWVSSAVDEGYTSYAASRIRAGEWPYRDFHFLWTPGTPVLHAILQGLGFGWLGERAVALAASIGTGIFVLRFAKQWELRFLDFVFLGVLLMGWSFSLWNIPYSSWYAVFCAVGGIWCLTPDGGPPVSKPRPVASALLFALSFWFKQNIGILSFLGSFAGLLYLPHLHSDFDQKLFPKKLSPKLLLQPALTRSSLVFAATFAAGLAIPFAAIAAFGGTRAFTQAFSQIFLFPLRYPSLMGEPLKGELLAAPLTSLGLWILSLFFLRQDSDSKSARMIQLGVIAYLGLYLSRAPEDFLRGGFLLLSLAAWPISLAIGATEENKEHSARFFALWLPGLGIFAQVFPRFDFQHFLFVFPLTALLLTFAYARTRKRYPKLPRAWLAFPLVLLAAGGLLEQKRVFDLRTEGARDSLGRISSGAGARLNEEVIAVWRFLTREGLKPNDPILVLPNATALYLWTGFRNPTPHLQFFPGYVESHGDTQESVLPAFRAAGGRFLVVQERSGIEKDVPEIWREVQKDYRVEKSFPEHFTIYVPR